MIIRQSFTMSLTAGKMMAATMKKIAGGETLTTTLFLT
jgi:hypothetical protein